MRALAWALLLFCSTAAAEPPTYDRAARLIERGRAAAAVGDSLSALAYYRDAISAAPRRGDGYIALGEQYLALREPSRALEVFQAGARWTRSEALWLGLAAAHAALGDGGRALDALRELRRLEPTSTQGLSALAEACEARGAFLEALAARRSLWALSEGEAARAQQTRVRALELLLGGAELVRGRAVCGDPVASAVARGLARCAP